MRSGSLLTCLLVCLLSSLWAAEPTGTIAGTVSDPSGAAVTGAKVVTTNLNTGLHREITTGPDGGYVFPLLPAGIYGVSVEVTGFRRFEQRGIEVKADRSSSAPIRLEIGNSSQSVVVEANAEMIETRSGALRSVITQQPIVELPLNGRNAATLVLLSPGTADLTAGNAGGSGDTQQSSTYPGSQSISANGARADTVSYNMDGGSHQDIYTNVNNPFPNPDAVEEFSIQTNSYSAEYGRGSGAIVNVVTRSGTNAFHGSAFEFFRNGDLNARNFFASSHDLLKRNQFGGTLGGPLRKDKLFFFGTYQGTQLRDVSLGHSATVFTAAQRNGDFSGTSRQLVNPFNHQPLPDNRIPASLFAPASVKLLQYIPVATDESGIVYYDRPDAEHENQFMERTDYYVNKHRIYGRYFYSRYGIDPVSGSKNLLSARSGFDLWDQSVAGSDTYTITPALLNTFVFAYNRYFTHQIPAVPLGFSDLGIAIASTNPPDLSLSVSGYFAMNGSAYHGNFNRNSLTFSDSLHWIHGAHEMAIGGDFVRMGVDLKNTYRQNGAFTFSTTSNSGLPATDFLMGYAYRFIQGGGEFAARRAHLGSLFFQDNYRAEKNLTVNLGVRWDPFIPYSDELGRTECFLPGQRSRRFPNAPAGYLFAGDPHCPAGGFSSSWGLFAPRLGLAYNLRDRMTIRGGWGIFYQPPFVEAFNNMVDSAPFSPQFQFLGVPFMNPYQGKPNPFPSQYAPQIPPSNVAFPIPLPLAVSYQHDWKPSYTMNWNLTLERQVARDLLLRAGYVGSKGTRLPYNTDINAPRPSADATEDNETDRRPYQQFGQITQNTSGSNSTYHALQLGVEKRFSHDFTVTANYTWAKSIDWVSYTTDLDGINVTNPYNAAAYRGVSDYNVPQRLVLNYLWQLPSPKLGWQRVVLGGWETSAIWNWQSGFPLNITSGGDYSFSLPESGDDQAQVISKPRQTSGSRDRRLLEWFTTSAFTTPAPNTFGNSGRNILTGPGTFNIDFSAHKAFPIGEKLKLQYRAEFFNFFNTPLFNNPDTTVTDGTFGRITTARSPRIVQMALKLIF